MSQHSMIEPRPPERYRPRPSGISIGAVVEALGLDGLDEPLARDWFLGQTIGEAERRAVADAIARALVVAGVRLAPSVGALELDEPEGLRDVILHHADAWEALRAELDRQALAVDAEDGPWLVFAFLRLVAIDLAIRGAAAGVLARRPSVHDEGVGSSLPHGYEELVAQARVALERPRRPEDERGELGDQLEAGLLRVLEQGEQELAGPHAPSRAELLELVRRGTRAGAARDLLVRLGAAELDPLWAADLQLAGGPWIERLGLQARRLSDEPDAELGLHGIVERARRDGATPEELEALRAEALWVVQADRPREPLSPDHGASRGTGESFMLPLDDHPPERARAIQREFVRDADELDGTLEHGRRALQLAPDDPVLLVGVGAMLAERACELRYPGWEYHVDVGLALLRRATRIEPRWDRPWVETAIVLADVGAWHRARTWLEAVPPDVQVTPRLVRCRAVLLRSGGTSA
jgi:hypothetical protein